MIHSAMAGRFALLAMRVLWRNRRRTLLTLASLVLGQLVMVISFALFTAGSRAQVEQVCHRSAGHLQIQAPGYFEAQESGTFLARPATLDELRAIEPAVTGERPRVNLLGLLQAGKRQQYVTVRAVAPEREPPPLVVDGAGLAAAAPRIPPYPILVGRLLARHLNVGPRGLVVLSYLKVDGKPDDVQCRVAGITDEGTPDGDRMRVTMQIEVARRVLRMGDGCHQQLVFLDDPERVDRAVERLARGLGAGAAVLSWGVINPQLRRITRLTRAHMLLVTLVVVLTSLLGIAGVLGMSVAERTREFGLFSAMGMPPRGMFACVLMEGAVLGAATIAAASGLAWALLAALSARGIDMTAMVGEAIVIDGVKLDMVLRPRPEPAHFAWAIALVGLTSVLASLWPAWRASRLDPLQAMTGQSASGPVAAPDAAVGEVTPFEGVRLSGVCRRYAAGVVALKEVDLALKPGELVVLLGPSGSGKSTLLNLIGALDRPTAGTLAVEGVEVGHATQAERSVFRLARTGFIFQQFNLLPAFTLRENVELPLVLLGRSAGARLERVRELAEVLGIAECLDRFPHELSGGQQQRGAIARALAAHPRVLLADEPTATLDSANAHAVFELIRALTTDAGMTTVIATHDARLPCGRERVIRLEDGVLSEVSPGRAANGAS